MMSLIVCLKLISTKIEYDLFMSRTYCNENRVCLILCLELIATKIENALFIFRTYSNNKVCVIYV